MGSQSNKGLYDPRNEHDACGVGFVANIRGRKSHDIIKRGLQILVNLDHRGAVGADPLVGDGAGCLIQMPDALLRDWAAQQGLTLPEPGHYAVAMCFLPRDERARAIAVEHVEGYVKAEGQTLIGWRDVPTDTTGLGATVIETMPWISQAIVARSLELADQDAFERKILTIRKQALNTVVTLADYHGLPALRHLYMPSFSTRTVVYKGLLLAPQVGSFYKDLRNPLTISALALVHQRFSTNTFPSWRLAHPYRFLCHNGEINTVRGNVNWMAARRQAMTSELLGPDLAKMVPLIGPGQSDTACIDNALELLVIGGGYSLAHSMMMLIPEAWAGDPLMDPERRAFYEYHAALMEPWDGPAAIAFTDGRQIGATLDRNGLRPARYLVTKDDRIVMASEMGVLKIPEDQIVTKWRLQPGKMLLVDLDPGRPKPLFTYFKQNFAQVTNPPIDPIREELVMCLVSIIGPRPNLFDLQGLASTKRLEVRQPILTDADLEKIRSISDVADTHFKSRTLDTTFHAGFGAAGMEQVLDELCARAEGAVREGVNIIILSDRMAGSDRIPIPSLLACAAVHHHLIRTGLRTSVGLVVESGEPREVHHFAGTHTRIEGVGLAEIAEETARRHTDAFGDAQVYKTALDVGGEYAYRTRGEDHAWTAESVSTLQHAVRGNSQERYRAFAKILNEQSERLLTLRGLFRLKTAE